MKYSKARRNKDIKRYDNNNAQRLSQLRPSNYMHEYGNFVMEEPENKWTPTELKQPEAEKEELLPKIPYKRRKRTYGRTEKL